MLETLQETLFPVVQDCNMSQSYQGGSLANLTALQENVWHLMTSAICGANMLESFARLDQSGSWEKMHQGFCQVKMDGSLDEFSGTWPDWGIVYGGIAFQPTLSGRFMKEQGLQLSPAPIATDCKGSYKNHKKLMKHINSRDHQVRICELLLACGVAKAEIPTEYEYLMGYPIGWTELRPSEIA